MRLRRNDAELVALRLAECDYYLGRHRASRDGLRPYLDDGSREAEARFFHLTATRALGDSTTYVTLARRLVADYPDSSWAEETLNNLASHYITDEEDDQADLVFRELTRRFPRGRYCGPRRVEDRLGRLQAGRFRRGRERLRDRGRCLSARGLPAVVAVLGGTVARSARTDVRRRVALYRVVAADYQNSYYGRLASRLLAERREAPVTPIVTVERSAEREPDPLVPTEATIRALGAAALYDDALREVEYAQRAWGDSPALQATVAWLRHHRAMEENADDRFADLRGAITMMRRAYPQFLAAGGEQLPPDVLRIIFPIDYWPIIKKYSDAHGLDPWLMTALVAQESTFTADVRSSANAVGLMQLIPSTARRYASKLGIRYSSRILTQPETNVRLGMRYFKDLVDRFGGAHYALASYNAGEHRIARWIAERPGFDQDEFIDDIPFPETQNYVKRILGTADDYRRLYGGGVLSTRVAALTDERSPRAHGARRGDAFLVSRFSRLCRARHPRASPPGDATCGSSIAAAAPATTSRTFFGRTAARSASTSTLTPSGGRARQAGRWCAPTSSAFRSGRIPSTSPPRSTSCRACPMIVRRCARWRGC